MSGLLVVRHEDRERAVVMAQMISDGSMVAQLHKPNEAVRTSTGIERVAPILFGDGTPPDVLVMRDYIRVNTPALPAPRQPVALLYDQIPMSKEEFEAMRLAEAHAGFRYKKVAHLNKGRTMRGWTTIPLPSPEMRRKVEAWKASQPLLLPAPAPKSEPDHIDSVVEKVKPFVLLPQQIVEHPREALRPAARLNPDWLAVWKLVHSDDHPEALRAFVKDENGTPPVFLSTSIEEKLEAPILKAVGVYADLAEAVQYAVEHPHNKDAQSLPHGFSLESSPLEIHLTRGKSPLKLLVGARLDSDSPDITQAIVFVSRLSEIEQYAKSVGGIKPREDTSIDAWHTGGVPQGIKRGGKAQKRKAA